MFADHVSEQLLPVLALKSITSGTLHGFILPQFTDHLVSEVLHCQMIHPFSGLVLGLWLKSTQFTHPGVGSWRMMVGRLPSDGF